MLAATLVACSGYGVILPGTRVCGVSLGGMTISRAEATLRESLQWAGRKVTFTGNGASLDASFETDLGVAPDIAATIGGCRRPIWLLFRRDFPLVLTADQSRLASFATHLSTRFDREKRDAHLGFDPDGKVVVIPERIGRTLDFAAFEGMFLGGARLLGIPRTIGLPFTEKAPDVFARDLEPFLPLGKIAEFLTYYADGNDRAVNIGLACVPLSEVTVGPGETFSFNQRVGPRTAERGYRKAPTFVGEDTVDDFGGGVCQVSTTLYVSMLKAGFGVLERYCHVRPVDYVPMGLDATVAFDYLDLKMINAGNTPCLLRVAARGGRLLAEVFGKIAEDLHIEIESRVIKEFPAEGNVAGQEVPGGPAGTPAGTGATDGQGGSQSDTQAGSQGGTQAGSQGGTQAGTKRLRNGFLVETVRKYLRGGRIEKIERLDTSMYPAEKPKTR